MLLKCHFIASPVFAFQYVFVFRAYLLLLMQLLLISFTIQAWSIGSSSTTERTRWRLCREVAETHNNTTHFDDITNVKIRGTSLILFWFLLSGRTYKFNYSTWRQFRHPGISCCTSSAQAETSALLITIFSC